MTPQPIAPSAPSSSDSIEIVGARTHNLRNISVSIRRGVMTVVTGVSGSGKSSLAFDTLYAEGQRRYVASMSTYARQFLEKIQRPDVDTIRNIPPAIALEQKNSVTNARSTIGTATEVRDYLRLLFARVGHLFCPECDEEVSADHAESAAVTLGRLAEGTRLVVLAPVRLESATAEALAGALADMRRQGFARAMVEDGSLVDLEAFGAEHLVGDARAGGDGSSGKNGNYGKSESSESSQKSHDSHSSHDSQFPDSAEGEGGPPKGGTTNEDGPPKGGTTNEGEPPDGDATGGGGAKPARVRKAGLARRPHHNAADAPSVPPAGTILLVADRVVVRPDALGRLTEALELAFRAGAGRVRVRDADTGAEWRFSSDLACPHCGRIFRRPEPALFSFSSPLGACPTCQGFGRVTGIDLDKVIPNWDLTLMDDPVIPWNSPGNREMYGYMRKSAAELPWDVPLRDFTERQRRLLLDGNENDRKDPGEWCGVYGFFKWLEKRRYKIQARVMLARYRAYTQCPDCRGARLVPEALAVRVDGRNIADISRGSIADLHAYYDALRLPPHEEAVAERLLSEIRARLHYLDQVGLGYLTLDRQTRTLSGGESQRINLATALGSALTDTLYVLDEPTVGLHSRDTFRLLGVLQALRANGNTVVVVEHDPDIILGADDIVDIGPGAGERGGQLLYAGPIAALGRSGDASPTARYLAGAGARALPSRGRPPLGWIRVRGARENNLQNLDVRIPRGVLCCVTGVSGSGKSTLVHSVLHAGFRRMRDHAPVDVGKFDRIEGAEGLADMILVDQRPIGRSTRSNPLTYVKAYDAIRALFASTREAKRAGVKPGDFSFNVAGGRCETCEGAGVVTVDMHFLADVEVTCEACDGKRFQRRILEIEWKGRNIDRVLDMTVEEAREFFASEDKVLRGLEPLERVGLGYLRLGQSTATLSGGEAQRLKLAGFLAANRAVLGRIARTREGWNDQVGFRTRAPEAPLVGETLLILDEPTTGLHPLDLERLVALLHDLVDGGASVLVVEHNLDLIAEADWIIDLGPEGGDGGGRVVAEGPPRRIMACAESHTGRFLSDRYRGGGNPQTKDVPK